MISHVFKLFSPIKSYLEPIDLRNLISLIDLRGPTTNLLVLYINFIIFRF